MKYEAERMEEKLEQIGSKIVQGADELKEEMQGAYLEGKAELKNGIRNVKREMDQKLDRAKQIGQDLTEQGKNTVSESWEKLQDPYRNRDKKEN